MRKREHEKRKIHVYKDNLMPINNSMKLDNNKFPFLLTFM